MSQSTSVIDSLYSNAKKDLNDSSKIQKLNDIVWEVMYNDKKLSLKIATEALNIAEKTKNPFSLSDCYNTLGAYYYINSEFLKSIKYHQNALTIRKKLNDEKGLMKSYNNIGSSFKELGDYKKETEYYMLALKISEKLKDTLVWAAVLNNLSDVFSRQDQYEIAEEYNNKVLLMRERLNDKKGIASTLINLAVLYYKEKKYVKSEAYYKRLEAILNDIKDNYMSAKYHANYAALLKDLGRLDDAVYHINKSIDINNTIGNSNSNLVNYINLSAIYETQKEPKKANESYKHALDLSKETGSLQWQRQAYLGLSTTFEQLKKYNLAYENRVQYEILKDSLNSVIFKTNLNDINEKYQTEKKENEIIKLKQLQQTAELNITQQTLLVQKRNYTIIFIFIMLFTAIIISYLLFNRYRILQKQKQENAIIETEQNERIRIAKDIHDELGSGLSKIALIAEFSKQHFNGNKQLNDNISSISKTSKELMDNMRDLVWVLNPENTTLDNLVARIHEYSSEYLEELPIKTEFHFPEDVPLYKISKEAQQAIFLTFKEALNNSVKHSETSILTIAFYVNDLQIDITVSDHGKGFDFKHIKKTGNGLHNMKQRIEAIGGVYDMQSEVNHGTTLRMIIPLNKIIIQENSKILLS